jgi:hypothetical protein
MNLHRLASSVLQKVTPNIVIDLKINNGNTNIRGIVTPNYTTLSNINGVRTELANTQDLKHIDAVNLTKIYRKFYINSDSLTGLNRALSNGGDLIKYNNLEFKIVQVLEQFNAGWIAVIACQQSQ